MNDEDNIDPENLQKIFNWREGNYKFSKLNKIHNPLARSLIANLLNFHAVLRPSSVGKMLLHPFFTSSSRDLALASVSLKLGNIERKLSEKCCQFQLSTGYEPMSISKSPQVVELREDLAVLDSWLLRNFKWNEEQQFTLFRCVDLVKVLIENDVCKFSSLAVANDLMELVAEQKKSETDLNNAVLKKVVLYEKAEIELQTLQNIVDTTRRANKNSMQQTTGDLVSLYQHAIQIKIELENFLEMRFPHADSGVIILVPDRPKALLRCIEKCFFDRRSAAVDKVFDLVRATIKCDSIAKIRKVVCDILESNEVQVIRMKYRMGVISNSNSENVGKVACLGDIFLNAVFKNDASNHIWELQVVHEKLYIARTELNSHEDYEWLRSAAKLAEIRLKNGFDDYSDQLANSSSMLTMEELRLSLNDVPLAAAAAAAAAASAVELLPVHIESYQLQLELTTLRRLVDSLQRENKQLKDSSM